MADLRGWLQQTFDTPERTGELLQPELDDGLISFHDFQLAKQGLPPQHTLVRWFTAGACVSAALFAYGRFIRVPRATSHFNNFSAPLPAFVGGSIGLYKEFHAKRRLVTDLDNPDALAKAILNVRDKLQGPPGRIQFGQGRRQHSEWDDSATQSQPDSESDNMRSDGILRVSNADEGSELRGRWAEIRRANSQQPGRMTSWDAIRQQQRRGVSDRRQNEEQLSSPITSGAGPPSDKDQERAIEQAKFDAMLEEERKLSLVEK